MHSNGVIIMKKIFFFSTVFFVLLSAPCLAGEWELTGSCNQGCSEFSTASFPNGYILKAGGIANSTELSYCEIYNITTGEWTPTDSMHYARSGKDFLIRISDTEILATGQGGPNYTSEIYNITTGHWTITGNMHFWHNNHTTEAFENAYGDTLFMVIGGDAVNDYKGCEVYDPSTGEWILTGFLPSAKYFSVSIKLSNGDIMSVSGGNSAYDWSQCAIYNRITGVWSEVAPLNQGRLGATIELNDGNPMIIGGVHGNIFENSCEVYNQTTNQWYFVDTLAIGRVGHCSESLLNKQKMVMGGQGETGSGSGYSCEIYNPTTNQWQTAASPYYPYSNFSTEILLDERVLAIYSWCEIYEWNNMPVVSQPQTLDGLNEALIGDILTFSVIASDTDEDSVSVRINWDDGEISDWTGLQPSGSTFQLSHSWDKCGTTYKVRAQSADQWYFLNEQCHNSLSEWGDTLLVTISGQSADPSMEQNIFLTSYPNPFKNSTTLSFKMPEDIYEHTYIVLYNVKGQEVKTFISFPNQSSQPVGGYALVNRGLGTRDVVWDGRDYNNQLVGSGIYFFTLKSGEKIIASKKMLLLR